MTTPLALFCYNRPKHVELALKAISRCHRLDECQFFIYCDGPKALAGDAAVSETRQVVKKMGQRIKGHRD